MAVNLGKLGEAFVDVRANMGTFQQDLQGGTAAMSASLKNLGSQLTGLGSSLTIGLTAPILAAGAATGKMAIDFEREMVKINTLVGVSAEKVQEFSQGVLDMAGALGRSPQELAEALFVITSAGQRGAEAMQILENSAKAAAIGLGDTKEIARAVTSAVNAYGPATLSAEKATDVLVATVREGNLEASELAGSLGRVIGIASQVGVTFADVGAFVASFTRLGVNAEEAVTALRGVLATLVKPASQTKEIFDGLGTTAQEFQREIGKQGLAQALVNLVQQVRDTSGSSEEAQEKLGMLIPNIRALSGVLGTAGAQGESFVAISKSINEANGITAGGFEKTRETAAQMMAEIGAEIKALAVEFGTALLPVIKDQVLPAVRGLVEVFGWLVDAFKALPAPLQGVVLGFGALLAALGPILVAAGLIISSIGTVVGALGSFGGAAAAAGTSAQLMLPGMTAAATGTGGLLLALGKAAAFMTGPWGLAIAAVVAGIIYFREEIWTGIKALGEWLGVWQSAETTLDNMRAATGRTSQQIEDMAGSLGITEDALNQLILKNENAIDILLQHGDKVRKLKQDYTDGKITLDQYVAGLDGLISKSRLAVIENSKLADSFTDKLARSFTLVLGGLTNMGSAWDALIKGYGQYINVTDTLEEAMFNLADAVAQGELSAEDAAAAWERLEWLHGRAADTSEILRVKAEELNEAERQGKITAEQNRAAWHDLVSAFSQGSSAVVDLAQKTKDHNTAMAEAIAKGEVYGIALEDLVDTTTAAGKAELARLQNIHATTLATLAKKDATDQDTGSTEKNKEAAEKAAEAAKKLAAAKQQVADAIKATLNPFDELNTKLQYALDKGFSKEEFVAAFHKEILAARDRVNELNPRLGELGLAALEVNEDMVAMAEAAEKAEEKFGALEHRTGSLKAGLLTMGDIAEQTADKVDKLRIEQGNLVRIIASAGDDVEDLATKLDLWGISVEDIDKVLRDQADTLTDHEKNMLRNAQALLESRKRAKEYEDGQKDLTEEIDKQRRKIPDLVDEINKHRAAGWSDAEITKKFSKEIVEATDALRKQGLEIPTELTELEKLARQQEATTAAQEESAKFSKEWTQAWNTAIGNVVGNFIDGLVSMDFSLKGFATSVLDTVKNLGKTLLKLVLGSIFQPLLGAATRFGQNLAQTISGALFGGGGPAGGLFGGITDMLTGGKGGGGLSGGLLSKIPGLGGIFGGATAAGIAGAGSIATAAGAGAFTAIPAAAAPGVLAPLGGAGGGGIFGGLGGGLGAIGGVIKTAGAFLTTNPIGWAILAGLGGFFGVKALLGKPVEQKGAEDIQRDFKVAVSKGTVDGFLSGIGVSKDQFEHFRKEITGSPIAFETILLPAAQEQGKVEELVGAFSNFQVSSAFAGAAEQAGLLFTTINNGKDILVDFGDAARQAVEGNFAALNEAWVGLFGGTAIQDKFGSLDKFLSETVDATEDAGEAAADTGEEIDALAEEGSTAVSSLADTIQQQTELMKAAFEDMLGRLDAIIVALGGSLESLSQKLADVAAQMVALENAGALAAGELAVEGVAGGPGGDTINFNIDTIDSQGVKEFVENRAMDYIMNDISLRRREALTRVVQGTMGGTGEGG